MDKKEYLMEQLERNKYHISDKGYNCLESIINDYEWNNEDEFREHIYEATGEAFIYYSDAFDYLKDQNIFEFEDAFRDGFGYNVCSIATYYLEDEISAFLHDYMDFASLEELGDEEDE